MAIRTIEAPGVEIKEIDLSDYTPAMVNTGVLTVGFAAKGEDYMTQTFSNISAWLQYYGEPTNEAERYFYTSCEEILKNGGKLWCCKLPYDNPTAGKYVGKTYEFATDLTKITTLKSAADNQIDWNTIKTQIVDILTLQHGTSDAANAIRDFNSQVAYFEKLANAALTGYSKLPVSIMGSVDVEENSDLSVGPLWTYSDTRDILATFNAFFNDIETKVQTICNEINAAANKDEILDKLRTTKVLGTVVAEEIFSTSSADATAILTKFNDNPLIGENDAGSMTPSKKFEQLFTDAFKQYPVATVHKLFLIERQPISFEKLKIIFSGIENSELVKFIQANAELFALLSVCDGTTVQLPEDVVVPTMYLDTRITFGIYALAERIYQNEKSESKLLGQLTVNGYKDKLTELETVLNNFVGIEDIAQSINDLNTEITAITNAIDNAGDNITINDVLNRLSVSNTTITALAEIDLLLAAIKNNSVFITWCKQNSGKYVNCEFAKYVINTVLNSVIITDPDIRKALVTSNSFEGLKANIDKFSAELGLTGVTEFDLITDLVSKIVDDLQTADILYYVKDIANTYPEVCSSLQSASSSSSENNITQLLDSGTFTFAELNELDSSLDEYINITSTGDVTLYDMEEIDAYLTNESKVPFNKFIIIDKLRDTYKKAITKDSASGARKECIGVIPVVTTAVNALYVQSILDGSRVVDSDCYQAVKNAKTLKFVENAEEPETSPVLGPIEITDTDCAIPFVSSVKTTTSVSKLAAQLFPNIQYTSTGAIDNEVLRKVGVVVFKAYMDNREGNLITLEPVESFVGDFNPRAVDSTNQSTFIDTIINNTSEYIYFFSNAYSNENQAARFEKMDFLAISNQTAGSLGVYSEINKKDISYDKSIAQALDIIFERNADINEKQIDIVVDAGVSSIAQFVSSVYQTTKKGEFTPDSEKNALFALRNTQSTAAWKQILSKYDDFCKSIRKDCMFVADSPRCFCIQGSKAIIRPTKPTNTIDINIVPNLKYISGINTSYGAGYSDWTQKVDTFTGEMMWCPPSITAAGCYIYTDSQYRYWDAPAGQARGKLSCIDIAFSPNQRQAGNIYSKQWNFAVNYPDVGIILEGQKTFQTRASAFDRVNVRRLFLRLERQVYKVARQFVYEPNNRQTRNRLYDRLKVIFDDVLNRGGIYEYKIICDDTINTPEVIDNNELRVKIGIKPTKTAEFILVDFYALRTGGSFDEMSEY